jgi:hypothetical protein
MPQSPVEFSLPSVTLGGQGLSEQTLDVPYLRQTASQWCWATAATMVLRFILQNDKKICQVASTLITDHNCCDGAPAEQDGATTDVGSTFLRSNTPCNRTATVAEVSQLYSKLGIQSVHRGQKINFETLSDQISSKKSPIEVAFAWLGGGGHVAVVRGVIKQSQFVRINDPWPDTGEALIPFSQLESAYGKGNWFDCWTDLRKQPEAPTDGTI